MIRVLIGLLLFGLAPRLGAQAADSVASAAVWVEAAGAAAVLVDGSVVGIPGSWIGVAPGARRVAAVDDPEAWGALRAERTLDLTAGDSVRISLDLPRRVRVETLPIRALVVFEDENGDRRTLGTAPLAVELPPGGGTLEATLDDYEPARLALADVASGPVTLVLSPSPGAEPGIVLLPTERSTRRRTLVDVGIGAAALAAGAVAVHYKFRADAIDDDYRGENPALRGDESLRAEARRLDRYSGVALGVMQLGVGVLAVRFILR